MKQGIYSLHREPLFLYRNRREFKDWCDKAAKQYGYSAEYHDLGHAREESKALAALQLNEAGASTQV